LSGPARRLGDWLFPIHPSLDSETLQVTSAPAFSSEKFLNTNRLGTVFMIEGRQVVTGEAILSGVATTQRGKTEHDIARDQIAGESKSKDEVVEALVREHSRLVYRIAYAVLRRHHEAEDATQETFMRVLRYSARLDKVDDPKPWLARIAWRVAVDRSRQHGRERETPLEDPEKPPVEIASADAPADEALHGRQVSAALEKLIAALPAKLREPLILSTIEEMSPREVAAALGINEAAVRSRVFRARQILREKLTQRTSRK
jgi:RNA polymerase sigma-70 factor, ECF subfamily